MQYGHEDDNDNNMGSRTIPTDISPVTSSDERKIIRDGGTWSWTSTDMVGTLMINSNLDEITMFRMYRLEWMMELTDRNISDSKFSQYTNIDCFWGQQCDIFCCVRIIFHWPTITPKSYFPRALTQGKYGNWGSNYWPRNHVLTVNINKGYMCFYHRSHDPLPANDSSVFSIMV